MLSENELARSLSMSRTPVRAAVAHLVSETRTYRRLAAAAGR